MKKAQTSQVFLYLTAIVVFATILLFGYQAITGIMDKGERVAYITFKQNLEDAVKSISSDYGSKTVYNAENPMPIPGKYQKVCFINMDKTASGNCPEKPGPIICDAWTEYDSWEEADQNVFLEPQGRTQIKVYDITTEGDKGYICFNTTQNRLDMKLVGKGDHTHIARTNG